MNSNTIFLDVLTIPDVMATYCQATKILAFGILTLLFVLGVLTEQAKIIKGEKPEFVRLFFNTVASVFILLFFYSWLFNIMVAICEGMSLSMVGLFDWAAYQQLITPTEKTGLWQSIKEVSTMGYIAIISAGIITITGIAQAVFEVVRYILLSILYVVGPLAIVAGINKHTQPMCKGWFVNVIQVSFWIVVLRIVQGTMLGLNLQAFSDNATGSPLFTFTIVNALLLVMIILTPILSSKLLSGENLGAIGTAALALGASFMSAGAGGAVAGAAGGGGVRGAMKGAFSSVMGSTNMGKAFDKAKEYVTEKKLAQKAAEPPPSEKSKR